MLGAEDGDDIHRKHGVFVSRRQALASRQAEKERDRDPNRVSGGTKLVDAFHNLISRKIVSDETIEQAAPWRVCEDLDVGGLDSQAPTIAQLLRQCTSIITDQMAIEVMAKGTLESIPLAPEQLKAELSACKPVESDDPRPHATSFEKLTDRTFELLVYELFKAGGSLADELQPDQIQILPVGADRGRDVILFAGQKPIGIVQCKKHVKALSLPDALREISRFVLAAMVDPTLLTPDSELTYVLAVSGGLTEPAQKLFNETKDTVKKKETLIRECVQKVRERYKTLQGLDETKAADHVVTTLQTAKLRYLAAEDLDSWLKERPPVYPKFFAARMVVDSALVEKSLADMQQEIRRTTDADNQREVESWYHQSQTESLSVVTRAPGGSGSAPILLKDVYVFRHLQTEVDDWLTKGAKGPSGALIVVVAPGGFGKSSLLWHCYRTHNALPDEHALLFSASLIEAKVERNEFERGLKALIQHVKTLISDRRRVIVCLDTFDVLAHRDDLRQAGLRLAGQLVAEGANVLISSRPEEMAAIPIEEIATTSVRLHLREYSDAEFDAAVASYCRAFYQGSPVATEQADVQIRRMRDLVALGRPVKQVCLNPLTLRMLFELYAPSEVPEDVNSFRLYSEFWRWRVHTDRRASIGQASGRDLTSAVQWVASRMLTQGTPWLSRAQMVDGILQGKIENQDESELLNRHLLLSSSLGRIEFFHQTFFEHAAARHLDALSEMTLDRCAEKMCDAADDAFRFPVYEQLFLLYAARDEHFTEVDKHVGALLSNEHPALSGAGLHTHMLAERGYTMGHRVITEAVRSRNFHLLKRFSQRIHYLHPMRTQEVIELIDIVWPHRTWSQMESLAQLFAWLAQSNWMTCKRELERTNFVEDLCKFSHDSTLDPEHLAILVFRHGLRADPVWSVSQMLRFERQSIHARAVLEFIGAESAKIPLAAAQAAQIKILNKFSESPGRVDGASLENSALCLAKIWHSHPSLAPTVETTIALISSPKSKLILHTVAIARTTKISTLKLSLIERAKNEKDLALFYVLMHYFMSPLVASNCESDSIVWQAAVNVCEALLEEALSIPSRQSDIISREFSGLYARRTVATSLWLRIVARGSAYWANVSSSPRLQAIALAQSSPAAMDALEQMCQDLQTHSARLSTLRGALLDFPTSETCFSSLLRIAETTKDAQPVLAAMEQAEVDGNLNFLRSMIALHERRISDLARLLQKSTNESKRAASMRLLACLVRLGATLCPTHAEVMSWVNSESRQSPRTAALSLLVEVTNSSNGAQTVKSIIRWVSPMNESSRGSAVEQLHVALAVSGLNLSSELRESVLEFSLLQAATEPQVSLAGRLINWCLGTGDVLSAHLIGLALLNSETARRLSATQKKTLCHHLDKPFVALYRRISRDELDAHLVQLRSVDEHLGRLIAVSLCKSERDDLPHLLTGVIADTNVSAPLRHVIQDYRQHLLRL